MQEVRWKMWALVLMLCSNLRASAQSSPPSLARTNQSEALALLRLRGDLGIRKVYWARDSDPCMLWQGIDCEDGHVVGINLAGLRRTVTKALRPTFSLDTLKNLPFLRNLNASRFPLPGAIPDWFGQLLNLQVLDLTSASINGTIPSSFGGLSNLKVLILADNSLTGGIHSDLGQLSNITFLDLSSNRLSGLIPSSMGKLVKLQELVLARNHLMGSIPISLGDLVSLNKVDLGSNAFSGSIPIQLGRLTALNSLILSNNSLNGSIPADIVNCSQLQVLSLDHNHLTGILPPNIGLLRNLSSLDLSFNNLTGVLPSGVSILLEAVAILWSHNSFYGPLQTGLLNLPKLMTLDLSYNYFNGSLSGYNASRTRVKENCLLGVSDQRTFAICKSFYSLRGVSFSGIIAVPVPVSHVPTGGNSHRKNKHFKVLLGGLFGGLGLVLVVIILVLFVLKQGRQTEARERETVSVSQTVQSQPLSVNLFSLGEQFSYIQLKQATQDFSPSNLLKAGHSGDLYQAFLENGVPIVVKRIDQSRFRNDSYLTELEFFAKASHTRLVPLLGHCVEREDEKLLVYKYMPNRDLVYALHRRSSTGPSEDTLQSLDWITRLKIATGVAEGLAYLHHECNPPFAHRDVQASSVLLDDKFEVRLGSLAEACLADGAVHYGVFAKILRRSQTLEHSDTGVSPPTCSNDVYCFGKVLLELISGKFGISGPTDQVGDAWLEWALQFINIYDKEPLNKLVDPSLILDEDLLEEVWAVAVVAKSCLNPKPSKRPLMKHVLKGLENPLNVMRDDNFNGSRSRASSRNSWTAAFFGSWHHSSSETVAFPLSLREEYAARNGSKRFGSGVSRRSQGSGQGEVSQRRLGSNEIFPEPLEELVVQASNTDSERQES